MPVDLFNPVFNIERRNHQLDTLGLVTLTKVQATSRPDDLWPEVWSNLSERSQNKKQNGIGLLKSRSSTMLET